MLVPHGREDAELGESRRAAKKSEDLLIFVRLQAMRDDQVGSDGGFRGVGQGTSGVGVKY